MSAYDDDPLVRALRAPGTPDELVGEADALGAYRAAFATRPVGRRRRALGRLGLGGGAFALSIALGGGVAAAYSRVLPEPVQDFAHSVLGPVGVPPSERKRPREVAAPVVSTGPAASAPATDPPTTEPGPEPGTDPTTAPAEPGPETSPSPGPTARPSEATKSAAPGGATSPVPPPGQPSPTPGPTPAPTPTPTPDPTPTPTPAPTPVKPTAVSVAVSATFVEPGATVVVSGTVTDADGATIAGKRVRLQVRLPGGEWQRVDVQRTDDAGTVAFTSPPVAVNARARLVVRTTVRSDVVRVKVQPTVTLVETDGTIALASTGGQPGDRVVLVRLTRDGPREVGRATLAVDGTASFVVEPTRRRAVYLARLLRTPQHLPAEARVVVTAESQRGSTGTPTEPT